MFGIELTVDHNSDIENSRIYMLVVYLPFRRELWIEIEVGGLVSITRRCPHCGDYLDDKGACRTSFCEAYQGELPPPPKKELKQLRRLIDWRLGNRNKAQ